MTTISTIPLHIQAETISLSITPSYILLISNVPRGRYILSLNQSGTYICTIELLMGNGFAQCVAAANCSVKLEPFYNNISVCGLWYPYSNMLQFQYVDGNFSVQTIDGTTLLNCEFVNTYIGIDTPTSGTSNAAVDYIQSSTGSNIAFLSSISTQGRFRNIQTVTQNTNLNNTYDIINCNATTPITISLPQTTTATGASYSFVNMSTNTVTISSFSGDTIGNQSSTSTSLAS